MKMKTRPRYPLASVLCYGPNHKIASKLVASIFQRPGQTKPVAVEQWFREGQDIRQDPVIAEAVKDFIARHQAAETISDGRVLGCPHEEGIDYPAGEECPRCPFWANLNRFTLEPKSLSRPLSPEQILAGLACDRDSPPALSLAAAENHREQMVEPFVQAVECALNHPQDPSEEAGQLFCYALAFLSKWREPRAFPLVLRWLSLPGECAFDLGGDTVTEWGSRLLALTCTGDLAPLKELIQNRSANEFCRGQAIDALALLVAGNQRTQEEIADYFGWLAREGLERELSFVWDALGSACVDIEAVKAFPDLRRAGEDQLIDPYLVQDLGEVEAGPPGKFITPFRQRQVPFENIAAEISWWACFSEDRQQGFSTPASAWTDDAPPQPYIAPPKVGRNEPCPCGSGKKYKKCCGG